MLTASEIKDKYISFFTDTVRNHIRITGASLVPQNDPTTLFTSSGMQPLIPYLMGERHPQGTRLVDVQNCFRAQDIEEIGDNRHTTFFRMLGNWSLGDYFKETQLPWIFEFLTNKDSGLGLNPHHLHFTIFEGYKDFRKDEETYHIIEKLLKEKTNIDRVQGHIHYYGADKNWWSRAGNPDQMPPGEIGGPTSEVFYDFGDTSVHEKSEWKNQACHPNCDCGRYIEIGNSVFMTYKKDPNGSFIPLPKNNVDFGGGLERLLAAVENQHDMFQTNLFQPIIAAIETITNTSYSENMQSMRIIADHITSAIFLASDGVKSSNKEQGYILRRLIRRAYDNINTIGGIENVNNPTKKIIESIIEQYKQTDPVLVTKYEIIVNTILEEANNYRSTLIKATGFIEKKYTLHDGAVREISSEDAFVLYTTHGLSPSQIKNLGYSFNQQAFAQKMEDHQKLSRAGAGKKFRGGLADQQEKTVMGHTATHLLHQAIRDVLGDQVHQTGSNITIERVRFDFNYDKRLTDEEIKHVEHIVNQKIQENLPVHFELILTQEAYKLGAIGLFMDTYGEKSKIYFIGDTTNGYSNAYSIEFCGGPHVDFTGKLKSFKIIKQENLGATQKRLYAIVD